MKSIILNREIFKLYWKGNLQKNTPFIEDIIAIIKNSCKQNLANSEDFKVSSNFCDNYNITDLINK